MTLRKYLLGTHITNIYTNNLERIIFIELEGYNKSKDESKKTLVVELMGKHSNIILIDNENIIIDSLKHFSTNSGSYRNIYAGEKYILPKSDKIDFFEVKDKDEFYRIIENNSIKLNSKSLIDIISNTFTGFSKSSINAIEINNNLSDDLDKENIYNLYNYIIQIVNNSENNICKKFDNKNDYFLINSKKENPLEINWFLDDYYTSKEVDNTFLNYRNGLLKLILNKLHKLNTKLDLVNEKINECKDINKYKLYGELITSNLYRIDNHNLESITLDNYYDNNNSITIQLDKSITPSSNAKKFFKKYQKLKNAKAIVEEQKMKIVSDIDYLESIVYEIESANNISDVDEIYSEISELNMNLTNKKTVKKKSTQNKLKKINNIGEPLKFNINGFCVLVGKNNKQNDYLTTKIANKEDIWLHVKDFQGSHVIILTDNRIPSQETINTCAGLAKKYSKASQSSNITVDYTSIKNVKKPSGSKPGMVIYTNNKSVTVK